MSVNRSEINNPAVYFCIRPNTTVTIDDDEYLQLFAIGVVNSLLALPTSVANLLIIVAIFTTPGLKTPSYYLLTSLAFSDLAMGLVCQPLYSWTAFSYIKINLESFCYSLILSRYFSIFVTFGSGLIITAISVDRYLAISLKLRYRSTVTLSRIRCLLVSLWIMVLFLTSLPFYIPKYLSGLIGIFYFIICSFTIVFCYTKSFRALKVYCNQVQPQGSQQENNTSPNAIDVLKYRKLLKTMVLIFVLITICYLPLLVVAIAIARTGNVEAVISYSMVSIVGINSLLNPIVYLVRMRDIRQACVRTLKRLPGCKT